MPGTHFGPYGTVRSAEVFPATMCPADAVTPGGGLLSVSDTLPLNPPLRVM
jgi:hypothetical protein